MEKENNPMIDDLVQNYQERINYLENKISEKQKEIISLQEQIKLLSTSKYYDV